MGSGPSTAGQTFLAKLQKGASKDCRPDEQVLGGSERTGWKFELTPL